MAHLGDGRGVLPGAAPGEPGRPARVGGPERAAASGELLHLELRRGVRGSLRGDRALRRGAHGRASRVEGGWRVYSSGAGIAVRLVRECLLGLRLRNAELGIDPVLPRALDGLRAQRRRSRGAAGRVCLPRRRARVRAAGAAAERRRRSRSSARTIRTATGGARVAMDGVARAPARRTPTICSSRARLRRRCRASSLDDFRDVARLERRRVGSGAAHALARAGPARHSALRLDFDFKGGGGFVVARAARRARDAGELGARAARARRGARQQARAEARRSHQSQRVVVAPRRVRVPVRLAAAAHPQQRGDVRVGTGRRRTAARARRRSRSRSPRRPADAAPSGSRTCASRTLRCASRRACARRARRRVIRAGARDRRRRGDELAQRARGAPQWLALDFRARARVRRHRDRLGAGRRAARVRRAG